MKSETLTESGIEQRYSEELVGTLGCFDRMIIFGTLMGMRCGKAVAHTVLLGKLLGCAAHSM